MISICITVKNRSRVKVGDRELCLFPNCVESIVKSVDREIPCELVVTDWESDDWPLREWLEKVVKSVSFQIITLEGDFSRGRGLNIAAKVSKGEILFFIDADSLICKEVLNLGEKYINEGKVFFPIAFSFNSPDHQNGSWYKHSYGFCMITKDKFQSIGRWPEYCSWGKEDNHFFSRISSLYEVVREEVQGFYHQWHPDEIAWKDRYRTDQEMKQIRQAIDEMWQFITPGNTFILVDETKIIHYLSDSDRVILPFLECNGEYWGVPSDDKNGITEFERMRKKGASFIVFAWMSYWWLEYYGGLHLYLRSKFPCILQNDRLVIFDLRDPR